MSIGCPNCGYIPTFTMHGPFTFFECGCRFVQAKNGFEFHKEEIQEMWADGLKKRNVILSRLWRAIAIEMGNVNWKEYNGWVVDVLTVKPRPWRQSAFQQALLDVAALNKTKNTGE